MKFLLLAAALAVPSFAEDAPELPAPAAAPKAEAAEAAKAAEPAAPAKAEEPKKVEESKPEPKPEPKVEAPKPEPVKAPEPKAEPKPEPVKAPEPKKEAPKAVARPGAAEEFAFLKAAAEDADSGVQEAAIEELRSFVRRAPEAAQAPDALFLLASALQKKGDWQAALATQLRLIHEYPTAAVALRAKSAYLELVEKKGSRKQRPLLAELVGVSSEPEKADRLSAVWQRLAAKVPDAVYEPVAAEIREVFARFPDLKDGDRLQAALARLHAANDKPQAALLAWRKLLALYPESSARPLAQETIGDIYADNLRDYKKAIDAYQQVIADYPKAPEVADALARSAQLFDERLKQYALAVEMHEKIVAGYPKTAASLKSYQEIARLQRERLNKSEEAVSTLQRLSKVHGGQSGVDALLLAASIARRDLKDYAREIALRRQVAADYADSKEAPQALYDAAGVYEDDLKDKAKAIEAYREAAAKFPNDKYGKKAAARGDKLAAAN